MVVLALFTGCPSKDGGGGTGSFTYDGQTYPLTNVGLDIFSTTFEVNFVSSGINTSEWTGSGNVVWFDLASPTTQGAAGTYDWAATGGFELWDMAISFDYVADTGAGTWLYGDWATANPADFISIAISDGTYTFEFSVTMDDGKTVTGNYTGGVVIW